MQTLKRNKQEIKFKNISLDQYGNPVRTPIYDTDGNETGEYTQSYTSVITEKAYVTANQGEAYERMFGENLDYNRVIITDKTQIKEYAILWVEETDTTKPYDYVVRQVAKSLNSYAIAIKRVDVNG